jgi:hypothetical protein
VRESPGKDDVHPLKANLWNTANAAVAARAREKGEVLEGMRLAKNVLLCPLLTCASGCRVVPIPLTHAIPSPVWKITVAHEATGKSVTNAEVLVYAGKVTSDVEFIPLNSSSKFWSRSRPGRRDSNL